MLKIGQKAPAFEAVSTKGYIYFDEILTKQPIVLIFYPKDESPFCTKQLCEVRDSKSQYDKYGAVVFGVNPGTVESHKKFALKNNYDFPLISDIDADIRELYGVKKSALSIIGVEQERIVYVIGKSGDIVYAGKGNRPTSEIIDAIASSEKKN